MPDPAEPHLLVIDDDKLFLEIVQFHLERAGYRVDIAADPREGLDLAIETDFDLILLDLMMPGLNGEEVLSLLKPFSLQHRVVIVSAHGADEYRARTRDLGAAAYVQKPVDPEDLRRIVDELVQRKTESDGAETQTVTTHRMLDRLTLWIFDDGEITTGKRFAAFGVLGGLLGVLLWLVLT